MAAPPDWDVSFYIALGTTLIGSVSDVRAVCPHCRKASTFAIQARHFVGVSEGAKNKSTAHLVLECNSAFCRKSTYVYVSVPAGKVHPVDYDEFFMYPSRAVDLPHKSVPKQIADDWIEAQKTMQVSAPKAAAVMFRRVLYSVLMDKGCKLKPLRDGVKQLIESQRLPAIFDDWLDAITDDGHDGAHPDRALQVSSENVAETMEYTSELLRFLYIEPHEFQERKMRNSTPSKTSKANPSVQNDSPPIPGGH